MKKFRVYAPRLINSSNKTIEQAEPIYGSTVEFIKYIEIEAEDVGDEYHTMEQLKVIISKLIYQCKQHNADYHHITPEKLLNEAEFMVKM